MVFKSAASILHYYSACCQSSSACWYYGKQPPAHLAEARSRSITAAGVGVAVAGTTGCPHAAQGLHGRRVGGVGQ